jgi:hypothetical protein
MSERIYLDVPFAENDHAKQIGARWDPNVRRWWIHSACYRPELVQRWLPPPPTRTEAAVPQPPRAEDAVNLPTPPGYTQTVPVVLLGLITSCWKCRRPTTAVVGLMPRGGDEYDMIDCTPTKHSPP